MPTWWARKSGKNKDDTHLVHSQTRCVADKSSRRISLDNKTSGDPPTPSRLTPRCSREFAGASGFSGFDSDEKKCHPLPRPSLSTSVPSDHVNGLVSGSTSISSVSSSGSAEDQSQPNGSRFIFLLFDWNCVPDPQTLSSGDSWIVPGYVCCVIISGLWFLMF